MAVKDKTVVAGAVDTTEDTAVDLCQAAAGEVDAGADQGLVLSEEYQNIRALFRDSESVVSRCVQNLARAEEAEKAALAYGSATDEQKAVTAARAALEAAQRVLDIRRPIFEKAKSKEGKRLVPIARARVDARREFDKAARVEFFRAITPHYKKLLDARRRLNEAASHDLGNTSLQAPREVFVFATPPSPCRISELEIAASLAGVHDFPSA